MPWKQLEVQWREQRHQGLEESAAPQQPEQEVEPAGEEDAAAVAVALAHNQQEAEVEEEGKAPPVEPHEPAFHESLLSPASDVCPLPPGLPQLPPLSLDAAAVA
mmetsp:Transcript_21598/g.40371  ORF Transcript_21598/g.40371 Transcript_21598/m.40371 type:complete len:104 (-) Transcript_21598:26-337(-)